MKQSLLIIAALLAGFLGGVIGTVLTREDARPRTVVRAHSFELIGDDGRAISFWGVGKDKYAVLAFGSNRTAPMAGGTRAFDLHDPRNQRASLGVVDDSPFLYFRAPDGEPRMSLSLSTFQKPILWMGDETGGRVWLGVQQSHTAGLQDGTWALNFGPEKARIGMAQVEAGGREYFEGFFFVSKDKVRDAH